MPRDFDSFWRMEAVMMPLVVELSMKKGEPVGGYGFPSSIYNRRNGNERW